jgi:hypothetical protein
MPYKESEVTVIANETGGLLVIGDIVHPVTKKPLQLDPQESLDLEDAASVEDIKRSSINKLETQGMVSFHKKGSAPVGAAPGKIIPAEGGVAPMNEFDSKLNEVIKKEEREDERTKRSLQPRGAGMPPLVEHDDKKVVGKRGERKV